jgi:hypothetical protein
MTVKELGAGANFINFSGNRLSDRPQYDLWKQVDSRLCGDDAVRSPVISLTRLQHPFIVNQHPASVSPAGGAL